MHDYLLFLLGLTPLLAMIILILKVKMPIHYAVLSTLLITLILGGVFWQTPVMDMGSGIRHNQRFVANCDCYPRCHLQL